MRMPLRRHCLIFFSVFSFDGRLRRITHAPATVFGAEEPPDTRARGRHNRSKTEDTLCGPRWGRILGKAFYAAMRPGQSLDFKMCTTDGRRVYSRKKRGWAAHPTTRCPTTPIRCIPGGSLEGYQAGTWDLEVGSISKSLF